MSTYKLGSYIVIFTFVITQFIEITFFEIANIPITMGKTFSLISFLIAYILMKKIKMNKKIICFAFLLLIVYNIYYFINFTYSSNILSTIFIILIGFVSSTMIYNALIINNNIYVLSKLWIYFSLVNSFINGLQTFRIINPHSRIDLIMGFQRASGFKMDPNFDALVLIIGLTFILSFEKKYTFIKSFIIFLGILFTFSRMGIILYLFIYIYYLIIRKRIYRFIIKRKTIYRILIFILFFIIILPITNNNTNIQIMDIIKISLNRFDDILNLIKNNNDDLTSAKTRLMLRRSSIQVIRENFLTGIGAYRTSEIMFQEIGLPNVAHDTYLEFLLIGGFWGGLFLIYYLRLLYKNIKKLSKIKSSDDDELFFLKLNLLNFLLTGIFLSITYNVILWFPLIISVSIYNKNALTK